MQFAAFRHLESRRRVRPVSSSVVTDNQGFRTTSKDFVRIRGAIFTVRVPDGETRCVKVRFTAGATCR